MRWITCAAAIALFACAATEEEDSSAAVLTEYEHALEEVGVTVDTYAAAAATAADVTAVTALQATYGTDMEHVLEELGHALDEVEGCEHEGAGAAEVVDARGGVADIQAAVDGLAATHAAHTDVADCTAEATAHDGEVGSHLDELGAHHDMWSGTMRCMGAHDGGGDDDHDE